MTKCVFPQRYPTMAAWICLLAMTGFLLAEEVPPPTAVRIAVGLDASSAEKVAAQDLMVGLQQLYPQQAFDRGNKLPPTGRGILLGTLASNPELSRYVQQQQVSAPESFVITAARADSHETAVIAGADQRGVAYGVYALLEKLGYGFYLSYDAVPPPKQEPFSFDGWSLADKPLVRDRVVFDWHNFLSGCSTWNLPEWQSWIRQSQKLGYNAVMVHAYGNNPMVSYTFNGQTKPVGYLSTTVKGRDWSTMHVNDVRRLWGGQAFTQPAFGADAALGPDEQRAAAAQSLMRTAFATASERGMEVYFADDVDTTSANPQELILTLPEHARFPIGVQALRWMNQEAGRLWLANPDTPEGYGYYRTQVETLLSAYPQITCLVAWFRTGGTPWMELKVAEMPAAWQQEYQAEIDKTPEAAQLWHAPQIFALGKVVRAFDRALRELGRERVQLAAGTWDFKFLAPCHRFFPSHVKLIGLDYNVLHDRPQLGDEASRQVIRDVAAQRAVIPVIWAHHDDGNYIGRPYAPFTEFHAKLADAQACGFGIIHWTTRPLDLFFTSHAKQVWQRTQNQPLHATCDEMAAKSFGEAARGAMGKYLERWVTGAPTFGRETSDLFIDRQLTGVTEVVAGCRDRMQQIESAGAAGQTPEQRGRVEYSRGLEEFIAAFFQTHEQFQRSQALLKSGDLAAARTALAGCQPERVIEQFAQFGSRSGMTRGEQGLVVSLNLRWLSHVIRHRQLLGLEPVRINFAPTQHDKLAQSRGTFTFHFEPNRSVWQCWGEEETGTPVFVLPTETKLARGADVPDAWEEIGRTGIESDQPLSFTLGPIMSRDSGGRGGPSHLPPGDYRLRLLFVDPASTAADQRVFEITIDSGSEVESKDLRRRSEAKRLTDRVDLFRLTGRSGAVIQRTYDVTVGQAGAIRLTLTPIRGKALICGAVVEPAVVGGQR